MSVIVSLAIFCAAAAQGDATPAVKAADTSATKKAAIRALSGRQLDKAAHAALRRWAHAATKDLQPAGREYLALYKDLQRDTALAKSTRKELLGKLRFRLAAVAKTLRKQLAADRDGNNKRHKQAATEKGGKADGRPQDGQPGSIDPGEKGGPLAQQVGPAGGGGGIGGGIGGGGANSPGAARDAGWDLVDLIESTISPSTWARNGGPGDIYYWRPGMALVVAAPQGVQEDVGGLVGQVH